MKSACINPSGISTASIQEQQDLCSKKTHIRHIPCCKGKLKNLALDCTTTNIPLSKAKPLVVMTAKYLLHHRCCSGHVVVCVLKWSFNHGKRWEYEVKRQVVSTRYLNSESVWPLIHDIFCLDYCPCNSRTLLTQDKMVFEKANVSFWLGKGLVLNLPEIPRPQSTSQYPEIWDIRWAIPWNWTLDNIGRLLLDAKNSYWTRKSSKFAPLSRPCRSPLEDMMSGTRFQRLIQEPVGPCSVRWNGGWFWQAELLPPEKYSNHLERYYFKTKVYLPTQFFQGIC